MKKIISMILALFLFAGINVFAVDQDIVDIAIADGNFTVLVAALQEAELVDALKGDGPFTVFAPTDAAFTALLTELGVSASYL
ncbi:MAG: fasciclin domain-containing protein, partial [Erysipelotrichaceae bacterium]|nr:fasciclin domain-containing protein [Erysipelotrichaceae bacterium]